MHCYEDQDAIDMCSCYPHTIGRALREAQELVAAGRDTIVASELLPLIPKGYRAFVLVVREDGLLLFCEDQPDQSPADIKEYLLAFERSIMDAFEEAVGGKFDTAHPIREHDELSGNN